MSELRWGVVEALLDFVLVQEPCTQDEWPVLEGLLDRLVVAVPRGAEAPECAAKLPAHDEPAWREMVAQRFPEFGQYATTSLRGADTGHAGDAIDDLLVIALELDRASWCRRHGSAHDGERYLSWAFGARWGQRLRDLQRYLHVRLY